MRGPSVTSVGAVLVAFVSLIPVECKPNKCSGVSDLVLSFLQIGVNAYLDSIMDTLRKDLVDGGYNVIDLPSASDSFSKKVAVIRLHGEASAKNGKLRGVETVHIVGPASIQYDDKEIRFSADLAFKFLSVTYDVKAKFMKLGPSAQATGRLDNVKCYLTAVVDRSNLEKVSLRQFRIHDVGEFSGDIKGFGKPLDFVTSKIAGKIGNVVKDTVVQKVEGQLRDNLNSIISSKPLPLDLIGC